MAYINLEINNKDQQQQQNKSLIKNSKILHN